MLAELSMPSSLACQHGNRAGSWRTVYKSANDWPHRMANMGTKFLVAIGILACAGLSGCDNAGRPTAANTQASSQPCNCQTAAAAVPAVAAEPATHHRARHHPSYSQREYEQTEHYSDSSSSRTYYQASGDYRSDTETHLDYLDETRSGGADNQAVWVDGYGKRHFYTVGAVAAQPPDDQARRDAWHGYDETCDDDKSR
jgi:hypothetical protein